MTRFCIFDLDGTLVNSLEDLADATNRALRLQGFPEHPYDAYRQFVGDGVPLLLRRAAPQGCTAEQLDALKLEFDRWYGTHSFDKTRAYDGCASLLKELEKRRIFTAVLSNKPDEFVGEIVRRYFHEAHFTAVYGKRPHYEKKPDPAALNEMIRECGVKKEECLYIGDSNVDVYTAHNAGVRCCGALWGFRGQKELEEAGANCLAAVPNDILKLL